MFYIIFCFFVIYTTHILPSSVFYVFSCFSVIFTNRGITAFVVDRNTPGFVDVKTAAQLVMQLAYGNKNNLQAGMIVAGWDAREGGAVYGIPLGCLRPPGWRRMRAGSRAGCPAAWRSQSRHGCSAARPARSQWTGPGRLGPKRRPRSPSSTA